MQWNYRVARLVDCAAAALFARENSGHPVPMQSPRDIFRLVESSGNINIKKKDAGGKSSWRFCCNFASEDVTTANPVSQLWNFDFRHNFSTVAT